jgi:diacylglycerol kinase
MSISRLLKSFIDALRGFKYVFKSEQNFRLQILCSIIVICATIYFPVKTWEVILVILLVIGVLTMELLNTALEYFADLLKPRLHHYVFIVKDIMAAAVFTTAIGAMVVGFIIFLPHFLNLAKSV